MSVQDLAARLIAEEVRLGGAAGPPSAAGFRVCEKLRKPLATYAGVAGFRSLLSRALGLAKAKEPWLAALQVNADGSIRFPTQAESESGTNKAARGGAILVTTLLELLVTFIGEALTLRLVSEVWPKAAVKDSKSGGK